MGEQRTALILLLILVCVVSTSIPLVSATEDSRITVFIRADGSIEPITSPIQRVGDVYSLTGDIDRIVVERNYTILDGNGYTISGILDAVFLRDVKNVTIKNLIITGGEVGIGMYRCSYIVISNNTITGTSAPIPEVQTTAGIGVSGGSYNMITRNLIAHNYGGIAIGNDAIHNSIVGNNITDNIYGIGIGNAPNTTIQQNNFVNNSLQVDAGEDSNDIFWDNGEEGNYWDNYEGVDINDDGTGDTSYIINENNQDNYPLMNQIPEFPSWIILQLFLAATLSAIVLKKRLLHPH